MDNSQMDSMPQPKGLAQKESDRGNTNDAILCYSRKGNQLLVPSCTSFSDILCFSVQSFLRTLKRNSFSRMCERRVDIVNLLKLSITINKKCMHSNWVQTWTSTQTQKKHKKTSVSGWIVRKWWNIWGIQDYSGIHHQAKRNQRLSSLFWWKNKTSHLVAVLTAKVWVIGDHHLMCWICCEVIAMGEEASWANNV